MSRPFFAVDPRWWPAVVEHLPVVWETEHVLMDLRWYENEARVGRRRFPGARTLAKRWGWTHWSARQILKDEAAWSDGMPHTSRTVPAQSPHSSRTVPALKVPESLNGVAQSPHTSRTVPAPAPPHARKRTTEPPNHRTTEPQGTSDAEAPDSTASPSVAGMSRTRPGRTSKDSSPPATEGDPASRVPEGSRNPAARPLPRMDLQKRDRPGPAGPVSQDQGGEEAATVIDGTHDPFVEAWAILQTVRKRYEPRARGQKLTTGNPSRRVLLKRALRDLKDLEFDNPVEALVEALRWAFESPNIRAKGARGTGDPLLSTLRHAGDYAIEAEKVARRRDQAVTLTSRPDLPTYAKECIRRANSAFLAIESAAADHVAVDVEALELGAANVAEDVLEHLGGLGAIEKGYQEDKRKAQQHLIDSCYRFAQRAVDAEDQAGAAAK